VTNDSENLRLDEILLNEGLVNEEQITDALEHQREHGGKIGSHLLRQGVISEADIIRALSLQFDCEGVVLGERTFDPDVLAMIPAEVCMARRVLPFEYDSEQDVVSVACEDPGDEDLASELNFVTGGKTVRLYIAIEAALQAVIAGCYGTGDDSSSVNQLTDTGSLPIADTILDEVSRPTAGHRKPARGEVLLVNDDVAEANRMRALLEQQAFRVVTCDSADDAIELIADQHFGTVFIKDTVTGDYIDLIDRLRKSSPKTNVRYYESAARLLLDRDSVATEMDLVVRSLELLTSMLATQRGEATNGGHAVGKYVDRLCRHLGLPKRERMLVTSAAYLHDVSKYYYGDHKVPDDPRSQIDLSAKLLDSLGYSPVVIEILRSTYINLRNKYTRRLPIEVLGGNIITVVDIFCDNVRVNEKLSLEKFEAIRKKFDELTGKLFLEEVVTAFVDMIQRDVLKRQKQIRFGQVLVYGEEKEELDRVGRHLQAEGFRPVLQTDSRSFVELFNRSRPNMVVLMASRGASQVITLIDQLSSQQVNVAELPTFILATASVAASITDMFDRGIEDIIVLDESLELLTVKMKKVRDRLEEKERQERENGSASRGTLEAMNLIDLLQALGPSRKTARLQILSATSEELIIYLDNGQITFAEFEDKTGAEAVWEGMAWSEGTWYIEPVSAEKLPEPNNELSNESILMEGVRLLDENHRDAEHTPAN
jgi:PleD family two-component response regulator